MIASFHKLSAEWGELRSRRIDLLEREGYREASAAKAPNLSFHG